QHCRLRPHPRRAGAGERHAGDDRGNLLQPRGGGAGQRPRHFDRHGGAGQRMERGRPLAGGPQHRGLGGSEPGAASWAARRKHREPGACAWRGDRGGCDRGGFDRRRRRRRRGGAAGAGPAARRSARQVPPPAGIRHHQAGGCFRAARPGLDVGLGRRTMDVLAVCAHHRRPTAASPAGLERRGGASGGGERGRDPVAASAADLVHYPAGARRERAGDQRRHDRGRARTPRRDRADESGRSAGSGGGIAVLQRSRAAGAGGRRRGLHRRRSAGLGTGLAASRPPAGVEAGAGPAGAAAGLGGGAARQLEPAAPGHAGRARRRAAERGVTPRLFSLRVALAPLRRRKSRALVSLTALALGATLVTALATLYAGVSSNLSQQFRSYGASLIATPPPASSTIGEAEAARALAAVPSGVGVFYDVAQAAGQNVVLAGADLPRLRALNPTWRWRPAQAAPAGVSLGVHAARALGLAPGQTLDIAIAGASAHWRIAGTVESGGPEDDQVFASYAPVAALAAASGFTTLQFHISGGAAALAAGQSRIAALLPGARL